MILKDRATRRRRLPAAQTLVCRVHPWHGLAVKGELTSRLDRPGHRLYETPGQLDTCLATCDYHRASSTQRIAWFGVTGNQSHDSVSPFVVP